MVFEQFIKLRWIEKRPNYAFLLGFFYSFVGMISARLIFPNNVGIMSVAFTSILLIPSLNQLLAIEENQEIREKKFSLVELFKDHSDILEIYIFLFFGIFSTYLFFGFLFPEIVSLDFFSPQLRAAGISGAAASSLKQVFFWNILKNNLVVLFVCFFLSLVYGSGSILFINWNASVWGAVFGFAMKESIYANNIMHGFSNILIPAFPHMFTEALSYFAAAIVGGILSKAIIREKLFSRKFNHVLTDALIVMGISIVLIIAAAYMETSLV
jgi:uncharacterized membrane protein SpoIIM required for sporulation